MSKKLFISNENFTIMNLLYKMQYQETIKRMHQIRQALSRYNPID